MMTLYIVFDEVRRGRLSLDQKITVSAHAAAEPPSKLGLKAGQKIELRYLIRAAAIKSANDAATTMAEAVDGSVPAFAKRMTAYAQAMGMKNTTFKNANGLTAEGHLSTAHDMAILGRRMVYDFPQYYNLFSRNSTSAGVKTVKNTNRRLLDAYPGADGIKTGYTRAAGFSLVSSARRGDMRVIVAMMGGKTSASRNAEVARLMDLGFGKMPKQARLVPLAPLRTTTAALATPAPSSSDASRGSTSGLAEPAAPQLALAGSVRPMPRSLAAGTVATRSNASIAAAIAEVNAELSAASADNGNALAGGIGRPVPRPGSGTSAQSAVTPPAATGSASTFASAAATAAPRGDVREIQVASTPSSGTAGTGGNDWGVQIGSFRAKGDAERQLLTTALKDVPQLTGGLRRVEAAKVQGSTVFRAQFVGLSQSEALGACATLARMQTDCLPLAPGV
jgi:D-alanyl-D-alanine carboxypeptidase